MLKSTTLFYEIESTKVIIETIKNLMGPVSGLMAVLWTIMYTFCTLGSIFFGGKIRPDRSAIAHDASLPPDYWLMNFNDTFSGYITLFCLMVVNNWFIIVDMYIDVVGNQAAVRGFFIVFYYFGVTIGLNIVIAFAIDMFGAVENLEETK